MSRLFPDCEIDAMPPFGHPYGMPVYVDACFPREQAIICHHEMVPMPYVEYAWLGEFDMHEREKSIGE